MSSPSSRSPIDIHKTPISGNFSCDIPSFSLLIPSSFSAIINQIITKNEINVIHYKNGQKYHGDVQGLKRYGFGILYSSSGRIIYQGEWVNDKYEGHGIINNIDWNHNRNGEDLNKAKGNFSSKITPNGENQRFYLEISKEKVFHNETKMQIKLENEKENIMSFSEREKEPKNRDFKEEKAEPWLKYEGEFKDGTAEGKGIVMFSNKEFFDGKFSEGKINGMGWLVKKNGEKIFGEWKNNQLIRKLS
jgi:hypothetical protein